MKLSNILYFGDDEVELRINFSKTDIDMPEKTGVADASGMLDI